MCLRVVIMPSLALGLTFSYVIKDFVVSAR
jgi:hypothetical protein